MDNKGIDIGKVMEKVRNKIIRNTLMNAEVNNKIRIN